MSRAPPPPFARGASGSTSSARRFLPATAYAPARAALMHSSSSIYDNDEDVAQALEEALGADANGGWEAGGGGGGGDEFGWTDAAGAYDDAVLEAFAPPSPPSPSPTRGGDYVPQQQAYDRTAGYYAPAPAAGPAADPARASQPHQHQQHPVAAPPIRPMPLRAAPAPAPAPPQYAAPRRLPARNVPPATTTATASGSAPRYAAPVPSLVRQVWQRMDLDTGGAAQEEAQAGEDDEEYWGGDGADGGFEEALARAELGFGADGAREDHGQDQRGGGAGPAAVARPLARRPPPQPEVRYFEELDEPGPAPRAGARPAASSGGGGGGGGMVRKQGIKLRPVSELPDMFRSLWRFGVFNAVQSVCFDTVYHSDENIVISAPTGAGKTVLFELAILRLFTNAPSNKAKVLCMAPTKSLCSERTLDWKRKFEQALGWTVQELTGDSETSTSAWRDFANARIIVTTPEKWDAMTRKWHDHGTTLGQLRLFCVDEVHTVGADVRGAVLEVVVSRMKTLGTSTRFVAVSATVPNIHDVAEWLGTGAVGEPEHEPAKVFQFGDEFRPCKLQKVVIGYPKNGNDFAFANGLNFKLYELVKQYSSGKPVLVFCNTRKGCLQAAEALAKDYKQALSSSSARASLAWPKPARSEYKTSDKHLAALLENGIATHHAGMDANDRRLVERLFIDGIISIVCSTSTLAVGVNLPARMVIIRGTKAFIDGQNKDYNDLEILQMIGRAGRPQYDNIGIACVMTEKALESKYSNLVNAQNMLESCLHKSLTEHVNSEITLRTITDVQSGLHWLRSTFLYVRITKNPAHYAIGPGKTSPETRLEEICLEAIKELVDSGVVDRREDELSATQFGDIMSKFYMSHKTFLALKDLPQKSSMRTILETLAASTEFSSFRFRQGEKSVLQKYNKNLKFPAEKVSSTADRVMILIQLVLDGIPGSEIKNDNINPMLDVRAIFSAAVRIAKCMVDLAVEREDGAIRTMLELLRSLNGKCWDSSSFVLRQLEGIGEKSYKILVSNGIKGFDDVRECEPNRLEVLLNRKPPYGRKLIAQAKSLPQFEVSITDSNEQVLDGRSGVQVELSVDLRLALTKPLPAVKKGTIKLWAYIATTTSDGEFIDFRRTRMDHLLASPKQFDVSVVLVKPSQRIVISVSCDLIAGSEVKTVYKPETRSSEFPIPSLGPTGDDDEEEMSAPRPRPPKQLQDAPMDKLKSKKVQPAQKDHDDQPVQDVAPAAPRQRADGKFDCNHACGDKTRCKHLCCREGLDKPPVRRAKSKTVANAAKPVQRGQQKELPPPGSSKASGPPLRIQPTASTGVSLAKGPAGKVVSIAKDNDDEEDDALPSLDQLMSARRGKSAAKFATRSPVRPAPTAPAYYDEPADEYEEDELLSSPSPPPVALRSKKRLFGNDDIDGAHGTGNKRPRISMREFASSSPIELPEEDAAPPAPPKRKPTAVEDTLFRRRSPVFSPTPSPPQQQALEIEAGSPQAHEAFEAREAVDPFVALADLGTHDESGSYATSATLEVEKGRQQEGEVALVEAQAGGAEALGAQEGEDDDEDFDAWLASSVVLV
ncbi:ATP-dependent DNA helicase MER3 [Rhodotorula kratochvilovae]